MIRMMLLACSLAVLAQMMPVGCPTGNNPYTEPRPTQPADIDTTAEASDIVAPGETVELRATATASADGGAIRYAWVQIAGRGVAIEDADAAVAQFAVPSLPDADTLRFLVTTRNELGETGRAEVSVTVPADPNYGQDADEDGGGGGSSVRVAARAGADQTVSPEDQVTLDGATSRGEALRYLWRQTAGTEVTLEGAESAQATFTAPAYDAETSENNELTFELLVRDVAGRRSTDEVVVRVLNPSQNTGSDKPRVRMTTNLGSFTIELYSDDAPVTVENFLQYVDDGHYDGLIFHRVIAGFVIQGGGYTPELVERPTRDPIVNESDNGLSNQRGTLSMARKNDPDSATSQFFVNLVDNSATLDPRDGRSGYAVFGRVVEGMEVVDTIATVEKESRGQFSDIPVEDVVIQSASRVEE